MILRKIEDDQKQFLGSIYCRHFNYETKPLTGILKDILGYTTDEVYKFLGDFGVNLLWFAVRTNSNSVHPDLFQIFDGQLTCTHDEGSFNIVASDVLKILAGNEDSSDRISGSMVTTLQSFIRQHKM